MTFTETLMPRMAIPVPTKRQIKAARKLMQQPYNYAAAHRSDAFFMLTRASAMRTAITLHKANLSWECNYSIFNVQMTLYAAREFDMSARAAGFHL